MNLSNGLTLANAANLELRVRKELQEQGLLDPEDVPRVSYINVIIRYVGDL